MGFPQTSTTRHMRNVEQERDLILIRLLPNLSYTVSHYSTVISNCTGNITEYQNDTEFISQRQDMHAHKDREKEKVK